MPVVPLLDVPVPQMVDQLVDVLKFFDKSFAEQVVEVPKIPLQDGVPHRGTAGGSADCRVLILSPAAECRAER